MNAIIEQARSLDGYQDSSELLQRRDQDWVLDRAGIEPRSLLDLGCGIGSLLLGGARRWPGLQRLWLSLIHISEPTRHLRISYA
ncbi:hypothetical protein KZ846_19485, partial [Pseudomonas aeruginosa]|nr:hypothetical protein [Pseudomonas aeruginosa]